MERLMKYIDWFAILVGVLVLTLAFLGIGGIVLKLLILVSGLLGGLYVFYAFYLFFQGPKLDWHLLHGRFLWKVIALVLLVPSLMSSAFLVYGKILDSVYTPTELINNDIQDNVSQSKNDAPSALWSVYYHFIDPGNQHMAAESGRGWVALVAVLGVFLLNGLLVSSIVGWTDSRKNKWTKGEIKYTRFLRRRKHYVIIGGNDMVAGIVEQLLPTGKYILILTSRDVESFRRELFSSLTKKQQRQVIIYYGNRNSCNDIDDLCLSLAEEVYLLGEDTRTDDIESYHDTINMQCIGLISDSIKDSTNFNKDNLLTCRVMFEYQTSFNILQVTDVDAGKINFLPFNYYEMWAQNVLVCDELEEKGKCRYLPLEGFEGIKACDDKFVHLVIVGMSRMGLAMAIEAAHLAHYPNFETMNRRTRITFIDASMEQEKNFFMGRFKEMFSLARYRDVNNIANGLYNNTTEFPWINPLEDAACGSPYRGGYLGKDFIDIEWEFIDGSIENPCIRQYLEDAAGNSNAKLTIAICLPENSRAIAAATYMPDSVYSSTSTLQVLVYQRLNDNLLSQVNRNKRFAGKLKAFGMASECYSSSLVELAEGVSGAINNAYDGWVWKCVRERFSGKGLIEDDYDYLSGYIYSSSTGNRQQIKECCDEWMKNHCVESVYSDVSGKLKDLRDRVQMSFGNNDKSGDGKSKSAKMWSNQYNIYTMWTKCRCLTVEGTSHFNPAKQDFNKQMLDELGKVEHNRWVVEQLLLRYRPLNDREQVEAQIFDLYSSTKQKKAYKDKFAHLDICSNDRLGIIDYNIPELDRELVEVLPAAYRKYLAKNTTEH